MHQPRSVRIEPPSPPPTRTPGGRGRGGRERRGRCPEPSGADGLAVPTAPTPHPPARPPAPPAASPSPPVLGSKQRLRGRGWGGERLVSCIRHFASERPAGGAAEQAVRTVPGAGAQVWTAADPPAGGRLASGLQRQSAPRPLSHRAGGPRGRCTAPGTRQRLCSRRKR